MCIPRRLEFAFVLTCGLFLAGCSADAPGTGPASGGAATAPTQPLGSAAGGTPAPAPSGAAAAPADSHELLVQHLLGAAQQLVRLSNQMQGEAAGLDSPASVVTAHQTEIDELDAFINVTLVERLNKLGLPDAAAAQTLYGQYAETLNPAVDLARQRSLEGIIGRTFVAKVFEVAGDTLHFLRIRIFEARHQTVAADEAPPPATGVAPLPENPAASSPPAAAIPALPAAAGEVSAESQGLPAIYDGPVAVEPTGLRVTADTELQPGQLILVDWGGEWFPADVVRIVGPGQVEIHYRRWPSTSDEVVPLRRIQLVRADEPGAVAAVGGSGASPDSEDYAGPDSVDPTGLTVTAETELEQGQLVLVEWGSSWYPADVLAVLDDGQVAIHYRGWSAASDETVTRDRIQLVK